MPFFCLYWSLIIIPERYSGNFRFGNPSDPSHFLGNGIHLNTFTCIFILTSVILTSEIRHFFWETVKILFLEKWFNNPSYIKYYTLNTLNTQKMSSTHKNFFSNFYKFNKKIIHPAHKKWAQHTKNIMVYSTKPANNFIVSLIFYSNFLS